MLFIETRTLDHVVDSATRILILKKLKEKGMIPLIHSARLSCYEYALLESSGVAKMENAIAAWTESENDSSYIQGDVFCFSDHVLFLIFGDTHDEPAGMRAGIIYDAHTTEPLRKLDGFCQDIKDSLASARRGVNAAVEVRAQESMEWRRSGPETPTGFARFVAKQDADSLYAVARRETVVERIRAAELLQDAYARSFLRCIKEAHAEGCYAQLSAGNRVEASEFLMDKLLGAGLIRREVMVSCRRTGHTLFHLPSSDALAVITISNATCGECGAAVADEKVEEVVAPTRLASALLEDSSWLVNRLHSILRELGIPESEIAIAPPAGDGEAHMMVNVCGEPFLIILRDGDLTPAFARRAIGMEIETEAAHLVVVATGRIHNEGRVRLLEHARRRRRAGSDVELILVEGTDAAATELQYAFERVSHKALAEQLCVLDESIGVSVSRVIITRFQLLRMPNRVENIANIFVDALSPSLSHMPPALPAVAYSLSGVGDVSDRGDLMPPDSLHRDH